MKSLFFRRLAVTAKPIFKHAASTTVLQNRRRNVARTLVSAAPRLLGALVVRQANKAGKSPERAP